VDTVGAVERELLRADCSRCVGLCCVVPAFAASADFAVDKPAEQACTHLLGDSRCGIHTELRERGFPGCTVYDCFGAGQRVVQDTFEGRDWRGEAETRVAMFAVFPIVRELHELLWYLSEALTLASARSLHGEVRAAFEETERRARLDAEGLRRLDQGAHWRSVNALLVGTSELVRRRYKGKNYRGKDLIGVDLRRTGLRAANLRGAYLIGADLRGVDLADADLIGADLRGADLRGADLRASIFLTQPQVNAAKGDGRTGLPESLTRPRYWPGPT
jgi:hypothetical protein